MTPDEYQCDGGGKGECGSQVFHYENRYAPYRANHPRGFSMQQHAVCSSCGADWKGPTE